MARDVIMPALGMAQDSGVIVSWLKQPGDAVRTGEPLMEVETDKAVMEVEAAADGFLADVRFGAGSDVPVGEVVARIVDTAAEAGAGAGAAPAGAAPVTAPVSVPVAAAPVAPPAAAPALAAPAVKPAAPAPAAAVAKPAAPVATGRILASPKARRMAAERGLDLGRLAAAGHPQPYRAADVERLAALPVGGGAVNRIAATARPDALTAFRALLADQTGGVADAALWAAFAAGALRSGDAPLRIRVETWPGAATADFADPDLQPLAEIVETAPGAVPDLVIRDLTGTALTDLTLASDTGPVLTIARGYGLVLTWPDGAMTVEGAVSLISGVAARIDQPLRHLL